MAQTKLGSFAEAWANIAVGFAINWSANMLILPLFGFKVTGGVAFEIGLVFTLISLARSYVLRRWFNGLKFGNNNNNESNIKGRQGTEEHADIQNDLSVLSKESTGNN